MAQMAVAVFPSFHCLFFLVAYRNWVGWLELESSEFTIVMKQNACAIFTRALFLIKLIASTFFVLDVLPSVLCHVLVSKSEMLEKRQVYPEPIVTIFQREFCLATLDM
jgi:hypothetical protein